MESNNKGTNNGIGTRLLPFIGIFIGALVLLESYHIRLLAIRKYGTVIHEVSEVGKQLLCIPIAFFHHQKILHSFASLILTLTLEPLRYVM